MRNQTDREFKISGMASNQKQIHQLLRDHKHLIQQSKSTIMKKSTEANLQYANQVERHIKQYAKIKHLLHQINEAGSFQKSPINDNAKFWEVNEKIERDVEERLKKLKQIDSKIDLLVNEEFDECNVIEEIQETIRTILNKKESNHINKAEPLFQQKKKCIEKLKEMKSQKQKLKEAKIISIRQLLRLLESLKNHRQARMRYCTQKTVNNESFALIECLVKDLQEVAKGRQINQSNTIIEDKLALAMEESTEKAQKLQSALFQVFETQNRILKQMDGLYQQKLNRLYFQTKLLGDLGIPGKQLLVSIDKYRKFALSQSQKGKQVNEIAQGINTTNETIMIFRHISDLIENQNSRKRQLLKKLQILQKRHQQQSLKQEEINEIQLQLQKIESRKSRLLKKLSSKADEADVQAYRSIHQQIQSLQSQFSNTIGMANEMKKRSRQNAKALYHETSAINDSFRDILSEVVPQVWFRDNDFTKQETIRDLNLYLIKTFNRLSITE